MPDLPAAIPLPPRIRPPSGACDTHAHVLGPYDRFLPAYPPSYPLPPAPAGLHRQMLDAVGLDYGVLVQPTFYGTDLHALIDALSQAGERLRGVGAAQSSVADSTLEMMHECGVRGLRFTQVPAPGGGPRPGAVDAAEIPALASRLKALGWHAQIWATLDWLANDLANLLPLDLPLVVDHMGMVDTRRGVDDPAFATLLALVREGRVWVKMSVCRCSTVPGYSDLRPFHDALIKANGDRLLWGSDWPFVRMSIRPDVGALLDTFQEWASEPSLVHKALITNPAALFGFPLAHGEPK